MSYITELRKIHFEISTGCNASCLACGRTGDFQKGQESPLRPEHLDLDDTENLLKNPLVKSVTEVLVCGNSGDPMASPFVVGFIKLVVKYLPKAKVSMHTNGSLGSQETWKQLGEISKEHPYFRVKFSIDGLEDTNHLYRIGVNYEKIMRNAQAFIETGGHAIWKMVEFPSSKHQVEDCRKKSKSMGFAKFELRAPYCNERVPGYDLDLILNKLKRANPFVDLDDEEIAEKLEEIYPYSENRQVECISKKNQELYVDSYSRVWPCCWLGNSAMPRRSTLEREWFFRKIIKRYGTGFNNLKNNSLDEILQSSWYSGDLLKSTSCSFNDPDNPHLNQCSNKCAVKERFEWAPESVGGAKIKDLEEFKEVT